MSAPAADVDYAELYRRLDAAEARLRSDELPAEARAALLKKRAQALSASRSTVVEQTLSVVGLRVGGDRYALELGAVLEILPIAGLWPLPGVPRTVLGVMQSRAQVLLVVDLRQLLGLSTAGMSDLTQVVVLRTPDGALGIGAEQVDGRLELPTSSLKSAPKGPFRFVAEDRCAVLDPSWFAEEARES